MRVIANGRQSGKTYALVQWVKEGEKTDSYPGWSRVILTHTLEYSAHLREEYDLDYRQVFSIGEWRNARLGRLPVEVGIDNVDEVLREIVGSRPSMVTMTGRTD